MEFGVDAQDHKGHASGIAFLVTCELLYDWQSLMIERKGHMEQALFARAE